MGGVMSSCWANMNELPDDATLHRKFAGKRLPAGLRQELMPCHVAAILDGNRRWGKKRGLTHVEGYQAGFVAIKKLMAMCVLWDIQILSLFMFSSENWRRPKVEVDYLMQAFEDALKDVDLFMRYNVRLSIIGDTTLLPISLQQQIKHDEEATKNNTKCHMIIAMSYGGQNDIVQACQSLATKVKDGLLEPEEITKSLFEQELQTKVTNVPCPDLLIRTSGEFRISNYYLWQSAYTEMYVTDTLWPDFGKNEFVKALRSFQKRGRRFGQN